MSITLRILLAISAACCSFSENRCIGQINVTVDTVEFVGAIGQPAFSRIRVAGKGPQHWNVMSTIWDFLNGHHSGPLDNPVTAGPYENRISHVRKGPYPNGPYTAGSIAWPGPVPPGQNAANKPSIVADAVGGGKEIVFPGAGGPGGGGGAGGGNE